MNSEPKICHQVKPSGRRDIKMLYKVESDETIESLNVLQSRIQWDQRKYYVEFGLGAKKLLLCQIQSEKEILNVLLKALVLFSLNFKYLNVT